MTPSQQIKRRARELGFARVGIARADRVRNADRFLNWLGHEFHGEMQYLARSPERRLDPRVVLNEAKSVISVLVNYYTPHPFSKDPRVGRISRYAWGRDYHRTLKDKLQQLADFIGSLDSRAQTLAYVDTGPVLDKVWAEESGLGWIGKHSNLITREMGSWVFAGEILSTVPLDPDPLFEHPKARNKSSSNDKKFHSEPALSEFATRAPATFCGTCTRCIEVCPTRAIVAPFVVDARRCISYLTIELRGPIPPAFRPLIGNRIFGCDDCQDVCPWNRFAVVTSDVDFLPHEGNHTPRLIDLMQMSREEFQRRFKDSAIRRAKYVGFLRNVAVALGNSRDPDAVSALTDALHHESSLVRSHAAWALGAIGGTEAKKALEDHRKHEHDSSVLGEIDLALRQHRAKP